MKPSRKKTMPCPAPNCKDRVVLRPMRKGPKWFCHTCGRYYD